MKMQMANYIEAAIVLFPMQKPLQEIVNCICLSVQRNISK